MSGPVYPYRDRRMDYVAICLGATAPAEVEPAIISALPLPPIVFGSPQAIIELLRNKR